MVRKFSWYRIMKILLVALCIMTMVSCSDEMGELLGSSDYSVGQRGPSGGYIFYDAKEDGLDEFLGYRFLEAAPAGWSGLEEDPAYIFGYFRKSDVNLNAGTGDRLGDGADNTAKLVAIMESDAYTSSTGTGTTADYATKVCAEYTGGGYDDWFLPSKAELQKIHHNLYLEDLGGFSHLSYWSSSELGVDSGYYMYFYNGYMTMGARSETGLIRPIRAF